jgi:hypothetical protein
LSQQQKFKIIKNESSSGAAWWRCFGFPAYLNEHGKHSISVKALRAGQGKKINVFRSGQDRAK